jgi:hypothetical protein
VGCDYLRGLRSARSGNFSPGMGKSSTRLIHGSRCASFAGMPQTAHFVSPAGNRWSAIPLAYTGSSRVAETSTPVDSEGVERRKTRRNKKGPHVAARKGKGGYAAGYALRRNSWSW